MVRALLRGACERNAVEYVEIESAAFDFDPRRQMRPGDLMYRPAGTALAQRVEQFLYAPGVATFYHENDGPFFIHVAQALLFERSGVPVAPSVYCSSAKRELLTMWAQRLGGYPLLAKMGGSAGTGVVMLESHRALCSFVDYALSLKRPPLISAFVDGADLWRVIVVGDRTIAAYRCEAQPGDFRATEPLDGFTTAPPAAVAEAALAAVRATRIEFGGVDVLERDGRCYVLESNFPCFFPHAETRAGIDVSGAMIAYLLAKAERLAPGVG